MTDFRSDSAPTRHWPDAMRPVQPLPRATTSLEGNNELAAVQRVLAEAHSDGARAARLLRVAAALGNVCTIDEVCDVLLSRGIPLLDAARGYVAQNVDGVMQVIATRGFTQEGDSWLRSVRIDDEAPVAYVIRTGRSVWITSAAEYTRRFASTLPHIALVSPTHAHVSLPLRQRGAVIGAMGFSFAHPTAFGVADRAFTRILAHLASDALVRASTLDGERSRRESAEAAIRAREEVLRIVAHDLRNPLNLVAMTAQVLEEIDLPAERQRELLRGVHRATRRMNRLIQDLLDAARIESGTLSLSLSDVDVDSLLEQTEEMFSSDASARGIIFRVERAPTPVRLCADGDRLLQVLGNLVANALKFVSRGNSVTVRAVPTSRGVELRVSDNGPGIGAEERERLFDRYWQADARDSRGLGLGLAIVKRLVEAHGGTVAVESEPGCGASFAVQLPLAPPR